MPFDPKEIAKLHRADAVKAKNESDRAFHIRLAEHAEAEAARLANPKSSFAYSRGHDMSKLGEGKPYGATNRGKF